MTQNETETRIVSLTVEGIKGTSPNADGTTQYHVSANIPEISKYPMPLFVTTATAPAPGTTLKAALRKGKLKQDKDGQYDNHFYWNVEEWGVAGAVPATGTGKRYNAASVEQPANGLNDIDRRRAEDAIAYRRRDALNASLTYWAIPPYEATGNTTADQVLVLADTFFDWLNQRPPQAPESPVQPQNEPAPAEPPGEIIKVPNQVAVPETMNGLEFVAASKTCGWNGNTVARYLGSQSATEWSEKNGHGDNYRPAWDACIEAWGKEAERIEEMPW